MRLRHSLFALVSLLAAGCPSKDEKKDGGVCSPGATMACYEGPAGTQGVGTCVAGVSTCSDDREWGACVGAVEPAADVCGNGLNDDCDADTDEVADFSRFEFTDNSIDDDCDGELNEVTASCDAALASNANDPLDYAKACDQCAVSTTSSMFGVTAAVLSLSDGTGSPNASQRSIRPDFGNNVLPRAGSALMALSTGVAADVGDINPSHVAPQNGSDFMVSNFVPADWLAANAGVIPVASGCPALSATAARDPVMFTLELQAPTNANAIAFDFFFYSSDFPEFVCSAGTDVFVALLDSTFAGTPANPADGNLARGGANAPIVSASLGHADTGLFTACSNGATGCLGTPGTINTCLSTDELIGTGHDVAATVCAESRQIGGGTGWLTAAGNIVPGEAITVRFVLWDTLDGIFDSTVLIDDVRWLEDPVTPGLQP